METIAILGSEQSQAHQAALCRNSQATVRACNQLSELLSAFSAREVDTVILPVYNTRQGEEKQYFRFFDRIRSGYWIDNIVLRSTLSLGSFDATAHLQDLHLLIGQPEAFSQCEEYLEAHALSLTEMRVRDTAQAIAALKAEPDHSGKGVIAQAETLVACGLRILERDLAPHNRTRYAVLGHQPTAPSGYDATALITEPLDDRVGLLVDILGEFSRRGINILDLRTENDIKTQKLRIYLEAEGHRQGSALREAIAHLEARVIRRQDAIRLLGSFPRVDMRTKYIKSFGCIGTGPMGAWFTERLQGEGYTVLTSGRRTALRPEEMIAQVDVVLVCVPISATAAVIRRYGPLLEGGKALILLAGESEETINAALAATGDGVEVMLVHNLWGPQAEAMKGKNAVVVRTSRSGVFCSEFEAFLYKHGAAICHDSATRHDLLMGVGQKLPSLVSVALAMTLKKNRITSEDIAGHSTLTSLYPILAMARLHSQNPRTYAEIMTTAGEGRSIVHDFASYLAELIDLADSADLGTLSAYITSNADYLGPEFLQERMRQAKAVDAVLGRII